MSSNTSKSPDAVCGEKRKKDTLNPQVMVDFCFKQKWEEAEEWLGEHSNQEIIEALEYIYKFENTDNGGATAIHIACFEGAPFSLLQSMITNAPHIVTIADKFGDLPLHCAFLQGHRCVSVDLIRAMTEDYQQTITTRGNLGQTPLVRAICYGGYQENAEAIGLLVGNGAVAIPDKNGWLPLHLAEDEGCSSEILDIIKAEFTKKNQKGQTPLLWAIDEGYLTDPAAVETLGANGASTIADKEGNYILHMCCMRIR